MSLQKIRIFSANNDQQFYYEAALAEACPNQKKDYEIKPIN